MTDEPTDSIAAEKPSAESFLKDVEKHALTVIRADGANRHLRFRRGDSYNMGFDLITWPGCLCYTGDMGTFVFNRIEDMFDFFRGSQINPGYWSEKVIGIDRDGVESFSLAAFRASVLRWLDEDTSGDIREAVNEELLSRQFENEYEAYSAVSDFEHAGFRFTDFWEANCKEYTYRFLWCCRAIQWGIQQFDRLAALSPAGSEARNWPDDERYQGVCSHCGNSFLGAKRRLVCHACAPCAEELARLRLAAGSAKPNGFTVRGNESGIALWHHAGTSEKDVERSIMDRARAEGFKGTLAERLQELNWSIIPAFIGSPAGSEPVDMLLFCPKCGQQHVDEPETTTHIKDGIPESAEVTWTNPPHRSHKCYYCNHIWRPADVATSGVAELKTKGQNDGSPIPDTARLIEEGEHLLMHLNKRTRQPHPQGTASRWRGNAATQNIRV